MPDPMIERAARALCIEAGMTPDAEYRGGHIGFDWNWQSFVPEVLAVLQAIREPSETMVEAAGLLDESVDGPFPTGAPAPVDYWQAMIDAALGEK